MPRVLVIVLAAVVVAGVALVEGLRSNRWGASEDVKTAAGRLDRVPKEFGDWIGSDSVLDPKVVERAEAVGYVNRVYTNRKTGDRVTVLLLCGGPGPIGAHTPEVCYGGMGYQCVGKPMTHRVTFGTAAASFWTAKFEKDTPTDDPLRVFWAWGTDGDWEAAANPRTDYALKAALYKLYVQHREHRTDRAPAEEFLAAFLPLVKTALTPDPG